MFKMLPSNTRMAGFFFLSIFIFGTICAQESRDVSCHTCLHIEFKLSNLPAQYRTLIEGLLSSMKLSNPACVKGQLKTVSCGAPTFGNVNKCQTTTVKLRAVGMRMPAFSTAVMEATVVVRGCIAQLAGKTDRCIDFNDMDEQTKAKMTEKLKRLESQWGNSTYSGKMCIGDTSDSKTTSSKSTESPLTTKSAMTSAGPSEYPRTSLNEVKTSPVTTTQDNSTSQPTVTSGNETGNNSSTVTPDNGGGNGRTGGQSKKNDPSNNSSILSSSLLLLLFALFFKECMH